MNIGILTMYYNNYNYGGQLQAYALCEVLRQEEIEAEQITFDPYTGNFWDKWLGRIKRNFSKVLHIRKIKILVNNSRNMNKRRQQYIDKMSQNSNIDKFNVFMENIPHTEYVNSRTIKKLAKKFDKVVLGGDQIWNPQYFNARYYGDWVDKNVNLFTYGVSGSDSFTKNEQKRLFKYIRKIKNIGVREENLVQILKEEYGEEKNIECVLDPVFLNPRENWENMAVEYQVGEPYLFTYLLSEDPQLRDEIREVAKKKKLKIITIPHARGFYNECDNNFGDIQIANAGPKEFLGLIKNATVIYTDSFHGTCFSIIFGKDFYCIENNKYQENKTNERKYSLLKKVGLLERLISEEEINQSIIKHIDYKIVDEKITKEVEKSKEWLKNAIEH